VRHGCDYRLAVTTINLSLTGMMVKATEADFKAIITHQHQLALRQPVEADIRLELMHKDQSHIIDSLCRAIYVRRISQNKYHIGFKFLNISPSNEEIINTYILTHLKHGS